MNTGTAIDIPQFRLITLSGRIASGSTTLAKKLAHQLHWRHLEGGEIFWEAVRKKMGLDPKDTDLRPDEEDVLFDRQLKKILQEDEHVVVETKLAGFNAQGIDNILKILVVCEDKDGVDQTSIRIDRLVNREGASIQEAKEEVIKREINDLEKWRKLYANEDPQWVYYDKSYYDLVINTYFHNQEEALSMVLDHLGIKK
jgi:cytidylate kinase